MPFNIMKMNPLDEIELTVATDHFTDCGVIDFLDLLANDCEIFMIFTKTEFGIIE